MGIKEINSLVKNLFQTGLKAFPPRRTRRKGVSTAVLCGFARKTLLLPFAKNPPNPLYKSLSRRIAGGSSIPAIPSH